MNSPRPSPILRTPASSFAATPSPPSPSSAQPARWRSLAAHAPASADGAAEGGRGERPRRRARAGARARVRWETAIRIRARVLARPSPSPGRPPIDANADLPLRLRSSVRVRRTRLPRRAVYGAAALLRMSRACHCLTSVWHWHRCAGRLHVPIEPLRAPSCTTSGDISCPRNTSTVGACTRRPGTGDSDRSTPALGPNPSSPTQPGITTAQRRPHIRGHDMRARGIHGSLEWATHLARIPAGAVLAALGPHPCSEDQGGERTVGVRRVSPIHAVASKLSWRS